MKDTRTAKQVSEWYDALHQAQAMRLQGVPDRTIAKKLNEQGYVTERGKAWSGNAIKRLLIQEPPHQPEAPKPISPENPKVIAVERYRDGKVDGAQIQAPSIEVTYEYITSEEEWQAMKAAAAETQKWLAEKKSRARDWRNPDFGMIQLNGWESLALAGKDTWHREVLPLIVQQIVETGKVPMDLIDQIEGQPDVKGQLRRVFFGMMRVLAKALETEQALRDKYEPQADRAGFEEWKRSRMVELPPTE